MPQSPHLGKVQNLEESSRGYGNDANTKMEPEPICFGTISPERGMPSRFVG